MPRSNLAQLSWRSAVLVAAELGLWIAHGGIPAQAADGWIGTWSTAEVGRPLSPLPPAPLLAPFMANHCPTPPTSAIAPPGQSFAPLPITQFANQTLRQIVQSSIGGTKVRMEMVQQPNSITFLYVFDHEVRHVGLNQTHPAKLTPSWFGDSSAITRAIRW
jgi:hypothetical protein